MGISIIPQGGLAVSVAPTGFTKPISSQTIISVAVTTKTSTNTVYTVTAGKTFYCTGVVFGNSGGSSEKISLYNGADTMVVAVCLTNTSVVIQSATVLFKCVAGTVITVIHGFGGATATVSLEGWEE